MLEVMQFIVHGVSVVSKVEDVNLHMRLFPKKSCLKLESTLTIWVVGRSQVTILVCKCKRTGCLATA